MIIRPNAAKYARRYESLADERTSGTMSRRDGGGTQWVGRSVVGDVLFFKDVLSRSRAPEQGEHFLLRRCTYTRLCISRVRNSAL